MTDAPAAGWTIEQVWVQVHRAVQHLADRLPDSVVSAARRALAGDDALASAAEAAELVALALHRGRIPTTDLELTVLEECLLVLGRDPSALDEVPAAGADPLPELDRFAPGPDGAVTTDAEVLPPLVGHPGVLAVWRTWRRPATAEPWPPPTPFYLVETADAATLRDVVRAGHGPGTVDRGPGGPLVEAYISGHALPTLHRRAQRESRLVHLAGAAPEFVLADLFDGAPGPDGRPQQLVPVPADEAAGLVARLAAGRLALAVDHAADDVLDPAVGTVVPLHLRTDGHWVWSEATAYYLDRYLVAPPRDFHAYLRAVPHVPAPSDAVVEQAARWLRRRVPHAVGADGT